MKLSDLGFRKTAGQLFLLDLEKNRHLSLDLSLNPLAEAVLLYGGLSHDTGLFFKGIAIGRKDESGKFEVLEDCEDLCIPARELAEGDLELYAGDWPDGTAMDGQEEENEEVLRTRTMEFLDSARDLGHPDLITVTLLKNGLTPEENQVMIEGLDPSMIIGTLMHEPKQNFGYHKGETVAFFVQQTEDNGYRCLCNMNPSRPLSKKDLEDGRLLKDAISEFDRDHSNDSFIEILECLRDSEILIPCHMSVREEDTDKAMSEVVRMVPEILRNREHAFLPVFSSKEEMKDFPENVSIVSDSFLHALTLAENSDEELFGIVINAFTEPFVLEKELFGLVAKLKSRLMEEDSEQKSDSGQA